MSKGKSKIKPEIKFAILAVILIAIFCITITPKTLQNDTYYSIKVGEHIVQNGIDMKDPFSWHKNLSYPYPHWLYDLITYFIYNLSGMAGIYIVTCTLSAVLGITLYFVNCKLAKNQIISFIVTVGSMYLIRQYITARAQLVTFILFVLTIFFIEKFLETRKKRYAVGLIIIPIFIANMHVAVFPFYFILYLPYIAEYLLEILAEIIIYKKIKIKLIKDKIYVIKKKQKGLENLEKYEKELKNLEEKVDKIKIKRSKELQNPYKIKFTKNNNAKWLIVIMIVCIFTGLLTPIKDTPYTYLFYTLKGNTTQFINEHAPMTLANETEVICVLILLISVLMFTKTKIRLSDLIMLGGLCLLMLFSKRQVTMFVLIGSIIFNRLVYEMIRLYNKDADFNIVLKNLTSIIGIIAITYGMLYFSYEMCKGRGEEPYINEKDYPVQACDYILKNIDLSNARFYNEYNYGSYMLFRGIPVFIDSRADLYDRQFNHDIDDIFMDFINVSSMGTYYNDIMEHYGITHAILYKSSKMNMIITKMEDKHYKELYSDDNFVVYERISEPNNE